MARTDPHADPADRPQGAPMDAAPELFVDGDRPTPAE
jgi:hypothetical protein